ncbi:hypothetical protein [Burkholderia cepacia]|uniref:hypothetical protein n=1 Tax=Burkholderia cepacia TaxID=292 RepID=UPI0020184D51|nr:hypothetical protein [Burkholderia cepacia]UQO38402.1 hypothetical protein L0Z22_22380 [Burkholderia cepacia]UQO52739.1 hypothetical protein L0Z05_28510 [Burkholderia cepacia]UQP06886.1 hypothetical protein L0Z01_05330 [Burkholderia cepacia]
MLRAWLPGRARHDAKAAAASDVPAAWGAYAQRIARWLQATLDGDNESDDAAVCRLRAGIERWAGERADAGDDRLVLPVRAWLDRYGHVTRIDSGAAGQAALDAALHAALVGRAVGAAPPRGMAQPLVLRMTLTDARRCGVRNSGTIERAVER